MHDNSTSSTIKFTKIMVEVDETPLSHDIHHGNDGRGISNPYVENDKTNDGNDDGITMDMDHLHSIPS